MVSCFFTVQVLAQLESFALKDFSCGLGMWDFLSLSRAWFSGAGENVVRGCWFNNFVSLDLHCQVVYSATRAQNLFLWGLSQCARHEVAVCLLKCREHHVLKKKKKNSCREELGLNGSLCNPIETGVLIKALQAFGACDFFSTQDHAAAGFAKKRFMRSAHQGHLQYLPHNGRSEGVRFHRFRCRLQW